VQAKGCDTILTGPNMVTKTAANSGAAAGELVGALRAALGDNAVRADDALPSKRDGESLLCWC